MSGKDELYEELAPILKEVMTTATEKLDVLEKKGYFELGRAFLGVAQRIVENYTAADVRQLGDAVVGILDTVRALTQPEVLKMAGETAEALRKADEARPVGLLGAVRATRQDDVQRGLGVVIEILRRIGRGAGTLARKQQAGLAGKKARLDAITGRKRIVPAERRLPAAVPASVPVSVPVPVPVSAPVEGWTPAAAEALAAVEGVTLSGAHWKLIDFARQDFQDKKASPNIRRVSQATGLSTKDIYTLFPRAPGRTLAKIAGLPKPAGCL